MSETPASTLPVTTKPLQGARVRHLAESFRAPRPRSNTRAQDNTAVLEETLRLFVEVTGKDEASMRQQLVSKRPVELLRDREFRRTRVEKKQRFQAKKKEAWEFFRRVPSFKPKSQEEFEEEFKRRVMTGYSSGSTEGREKYLDEWKIELRKKALEGDSRLEARERVKMGEEDSSSRRRTEWERIFDRSPFLKTASWAVASDATSSPQWGQLSATSQGFAPSLRGGACDDQGKQFAWEDPSQRDPTNAT